MPDRTDDTIELGWSREAHDRRQAALGLELTPAERVAWLERTMDQLVRVLGRARRPPGAHDDDRSADAG